MRFLRGSAWPGRSVCSAVVSLLVVGLWSPLAQAQELAEGEVFEMSLADLLELPVTAASKFMERLPDAPSSVTVFTGEEMRRMGITSIQELLNFVPGYQSTRDVEQGDTMRISSRGRSTYLSESVLVVVDGERLNDVYSGGAVLLNRVLTTGHIKRVEIIRGPGSALYGSNAFMGVIDITTETDANAMEVTYGENQKMGVAGQFSYSDEDMMVSGYVDAVRDDGFDYDGVTDVFGMEEPQNDASRHLEAGVQWSWKELSVHLRHAEHDSGGFLTFATSQDAAGHDAAGQDNVSLRYATEVTEKVDVQAMVFGRRDVWNVNAKLIPSAFDLGGFELTSPVYGGPSYTAYALGASADAQWQVLDDNQLSAGVFYEWDKPNEAITLSNYNLLTLEPLPRFASTDSGFNITDARHIGGFYVQDRHSFDDVVIATVGVRGDFYSDFGSSFNPRAAVAYRTPIESTVKLMVGRAFRAPNYLELFDRNNPVDFGNSGLGAEVIDTLEAAYVQQLGRTLYGTATYFLNDLRNGIRFGADASSKPANFLGAPSFDNGESQRSHGVEVELRVNPVPGYDLYASCTWLDTLEGDPIASAVLFGSMAFNVQFADFNVNLNGIWRAFEASANRDPHIVFNARLGYALTEHVSAYLDGRNILDEEYLTLSSLLPQGVPNRGREVIGGVRTAF